MKKNNTQEDWIGILKRIVGTILGFGLYHLVKRKRFVLILSSMRSGSTLLKALLAEAPEVEHLNERYFEISGNKYYVYWVFFRYSKQPIVVIKQPAFYTNFRHYPQLPPLAHAAIILVRNPVDCMLSIQKMNKRVLQNKTEENIIDYWTTTYRNLEFLRMRDNVYTVHYESLIAEPQKITAKLYNFIGSKRTEGTVTYSQPQESWGWGKDDGGQDIKAGRVVKRRNSHHEQNTFVKKILSSAVVREVARQYEIKMPEG